MNRGKELGNSPPVTLATLQERIIELNESETSRETAKEALRESEDQFKNSFSQSPSGIEIYNADGELIEINREGLEIFGVADIEAVRGFNLFADPNLSSGTRQKLMRGEAVAFESLFDFDLIQRLELYKTSKSGQCIIDCLITPLKSSQQVITGYLVHVRDVTERKKITHMLEQSERRFRALIEHSTDAITLIDANARVLYESPSVSLLTGYSSEERLGKNGLDLIYADDVPSIKATLAHVLKQPNQIADAQFRSVRKDGSVWWTEGTAINLLNEPGVQAIVINYRDVTERKNAENALKNANGQLNIHIAEVEKLQAELREQALRDPLTGLYNRRYLGDAMERELARVKRDHRSLSVIVIDIDRFKKINDNFGHQIGDQFLVQISNLIASHTRSSDIACRYGGEEFLLVIPSATLKTALRRAEQIRKQAEDIRISIGKKQLKVTLSLGVATYPKHGKGAEEIVVKADKAMYKAKRAGRNCVAAWE